MKKRIVLCADDYGQAEAVSRGILALIARNRLSATSCMTNSPYWSEHAKWLLPNREKADIGLHFNLTEGKALSSAWINTYGANFPSLSTLLAKTLFGTLNQAVVEAECQAQLNEFQEALGFLPDFLDGHQHIHQFPIIRSAILNVYKARLQASGAYLRLVKINPKDNDWMAALKKTIIQLTGSKAFEQLLIQHHIPHNQSFAGIYSFNKADQYGHYFNKFILAVRDKGLIMCHPGAASHHTKDPIAPSRAKELAYMESPEFENLCHKMNVEIVRFIHG